MEALLLKLIIPSLAGYVLLTRCLFLRVRTYYLPKSQLVLESVCYGIALLYVSYSISHAVNCDFFDISTQNTLKENIHVLWNAGTLPLRSELKQNSLSNELLNFQYSNESFFTALIVVFLILTQNIVAFIEKHNPFSRISDWVLRKRFLGQTKTQKILGWIIWPFFYLEKIPSYDLDRKLIDNRAYYGDHLDKFLAMALKTTSLVQITLKNRKVYVGFVIALPPLTIGRTFINISPIQSGYRDSENLTISPKILEYNSIFDIIFQHPDWEKKDVIDVDGIMINPKIVEKSFDEGIVLDGQEILSVALWDGEIHKYYQQQIKSN